jgi:MFS family permease
MQMIRRGFELIFRKRDFGLLMGVQFAAQAGDGIVQAALAKVVAFGGQKGFDIENARDPEELLRIVLYVLVPYTILSPFFGVVIDRWERQRLLFASNALRAVVVGGIALAGTAEVGDASLFAAFLLTLSMTRVVLATKAAALPAALEEGSLVEGNAVSQLGGAMFQLGGAGLSIIATSAIDTDPVVLFGAAVYGIAAVLSLLIRKAGEPRAIKLTFLQETARVAANIWAGLKEVARTPKAASSVTTYFWLRLLWSFAIVGIGFSARELLADDDDLQLLIITGGSGAIGAALGFILANRLHQRVRTTAYLVLAASSVAGGGAALLGLVDTKVSLAALTFCLGFGFFLGKISLDSMVQESLGDDFRGRAFSLYDIAYNFAWLAAAGTLQLLWSEGASGGNQGVLISGMGVVFLVGLAGIGIWYRKAGLLSEPRTAEAR